MFVHLLPFNFSKDQLSYLQPADSVLVLTKQRFIYNLSYSFESDGIFCNTSKCYLY